MIHDQCPATPASLCCIPAWMLIYHLDIISPRYTCIVFSHNKHLLHNQLNPRSTAIPSTAILIKPRVSKFTLFSKHNHNHRPFIDAYYLLLEPLDYHLAVRHNQISLIYSLYQSENMYKTSSTSPITSRPPYYHSAPVSLTPAQSITQTYSLAHIARRKLAREASRSDLHLGRLVGHANLLDSLMLELGRAEREQQQWLLTQSQKSHQSEGARHIQWADCVVEEETTDDWHASEADSDIESEYDDENVEIEEDEDYEDEDMEANMEADMVSLQRVSSYRILPTVTTLTRPSTPKHTKEFDDVEILQLEYSPSHSSPPELDHDSDSSEDESMPPSPPADRISSFFRDDSPTIVDPSQDHLSSDLSSQDPSITAKSFFHSQTKNDHLTPAGIYSIQY